MSGTDAAAASAVCIETASRRPPHPWRTTDRHSELDIVRLELFISNLKTGFDTKEIKTWKANFDYFCQIGKSKSTKNQSKVKLEAKSGVQGDQAAPKSPKLTPSDAQILPKVAQSCPKTPKVVQKAPKMRPKVFPNWDKLK